LTIRRLRAADIDQLLELYDAVAAERLYIGPEPGYDRERRRTRFEEVLDDDARPAFVTIDGDRVVGELDVFQHAEFGQTIGMLVAATHRRRGIGRGLMECAIDWARERGLKELSLLVFPHNRAAIALYDSLGFKEVARFERDVTRATGEVWDSILMRLRIT
jgi:[ribosomal protein S18]-alanine N-acetyltransferase